MNMVYTIIVLSQECPSFKPQTALLSISLFLSPFNTRNNNENKEETLNLGITWDLCVVSWIDFCYVHVPIGINSALSQISGPKVQYFAHTHAQKTRDMNQLLFLTCLLYILARIWKFWYKSLITCLHSWCWI